VTRDTPNSLFRPIHPAELDRINALYASEQFLPSAADDHQYVLEINGQIAALGRLVPISDRAVELGGIVVLPKFRGQSLARVLVEHLIREAGALDIYCIPFAPLVDFYKSFGLRDPAPDDPIPEKVASKLAWCQAEYRERTSLLIRRP
jgi:N-acetylglutamate synthase-like GNAT family acetyltransferase